MTAFGSEPSGLHFTWCVPAPQVVTQPFMNPFVDKKWNCGPTETSQNLAADFRTANICAKYVVFCPRPLIVSR